MFDLLMARKGRPSAARKLVNRTVARIAATVADPIDVYTPDELPAIEDIEAAAALYFRAADQARTADRAKRKARKLLDRLPSGRHGSWDITREPSGRETVDLEAVRKLFKDNGLGPVPMRQSAPSLKVRRTVVALAPVEVSAQGLCARCDRSWSPDDLSPDLNGDSVCVDCHASDPGDDRAAHRDYAYAGR